MKIKRALISVWDKAGIIEFAQQLREFGVEILSTGGTAKALKKEEIHVIDVSEYTGFPELFEGRIKTLHPRIHGGLMYIRDRALHEAEAGKYDIEPIDMVVVNLYPFEKTTLKPGVRFEDVIEDIDIGGTAMLRSAAKNHKFVTAVIDPVDYDSVLTNMQLNKGSTSHRFREYLAAKVFTATSRYDDTIAEYLSTHSNV